MSSQGAARPEYQGLICRGVEECGRLIDGTPGWGGDIVCLFVSDKNPLSAVQSLEEHLAWVHDPLHSDIADGTGGLVVWAHPGQYHVVTMLSLPGLAGLEVHRPSPADRDQMWDQMLTTCWETGRPFLWAFPADDTHNIKRIGLSWYQALLPKITESALKQALRAGAFYVSNGPRIERVRLDDGVITLTLGQESDVAWLRSGQHMSRPKLKPGSSWDIDASWRPAPFTVSPEVGAERCLQLDRGVMTASFEVGEHGAPEELKFIRAIVLNEPDEEVGSDVWRLPVCAMTQPWRLHPGGGSTTRILKRGPGCGEWCTTIRTRWPAAARTSCGSGSPIRISDSAGHSRPTTATGKLPIRGSRATGRRGSSPCSRIACAAEKKGRSRFGARISPPARPSSSVRADWR